MKRPTLNFSTIRTFEVVGRHLNFTHAAAELNMTQAAVSYRIKTLEAQLGIPLFSRYNQGVTLTEAGRSYLLIVCDALRHLEDGTRWLMARQVGEVGTLRILVMQAFASLWLVPRLQRFRMKHPEIDVQVVSWIGGVTALDAIDFSRHGIDATILRSSMNDMHPGLWVEPIATDSAIAVASPELLRTRALATLADLRNHLLLHAITWPDIWGDWLNAMGVPRLKPAGEMRLQHTGFTVQAAKNGLGVAMAHAPLVAEELADGTLVAPLPMALPIDRSYLFVCPIDRADKPAVVRFRGWLHDEMSSPSRSEGIASDA
jgi:LysR family transcriptional regulator, glycine cleavage system transcriptional activator